MSQIQLVFLFFCCMSDIPFFPDSVIHTFSRDRSNWTYQYIYILFSFVYRQAITARVNEKFTAIKAVNPLKIGGRPTALRVGWWIKKVSKLCAHRLPGVF